MGAQNYFAPRAGYPAMPLLLGLTKCFFTLSKKTKTIYWQQKTA